jgi:hypothetical protein
LFLDLEKNAVGLSLLSIRVLDSEEKAAEEDDCLPVRQSHGLSFHSMTTLKSPIGKPNG